MTTSQLSRNSTPSIYRTIGKRIRTERTAIGMSQDELARRIGTNRPALTQIENGRQKCAIHELLAIAGVLGFSVYDLLIELEATQP